MTGFKLGVDRDLETGEAKRVREDRLDIMSFKMQNRSILDDSGVMVTSTVQLTLLQHLNRGQLIELTEPEMNINESRYRVMTTIGALTGARKYNLMEVKHGVA